MRLDGITVDESDSVFVVRPVDLAVGANGDFYVSDVGESRVIRIDRSGRVVAGYGRKGSGPGEFASPGWLALSSNSLFVADRGNQRVTVFRLGEGDGTYSHSIPIPPSAGRIHEYAGDLYVGVFRMDSGTSLARVTSDGSLFPEGGVPALAVEYPMLTGAFSNQAFLVESTTVYSLNELSGALHWWPRGTGAVSAVELPRRLRKGVKAEDYRTMILDPSKAASLAWEHSIPMLLGRSASGHLVAAMYDVEPDAELSGQSFRGRFFITLVDPVKRLACVDIPLPVPEDPPARLALRGDTLFAVEQEVYESGRSRTAIGVFLIQPDACQWVALQSDTQP